MKNAFIKALTSTNIVSGFKRSEGYPVHPSWIIRNKFPASYENPDQTVTFSQLQSMLAEKLKSAEHYGCLQPIVSKRGQVSIKKRLVVTSAEACDLVRSRHKSYVRNAQEKGLQS